MIKLKINSKEIHVGTLYRPPDTNFNNLNLLICHILFGTSRKVSGINEKIEYVHKVNNLEVIFDSEFTFSSHVPHICRECYLKFRQLITHKNILNEKTKLLLINSLIL